MPQVALAIATLAGRHSLEWTLALTTPQIEAFFDHLCIETAGDSIVEHSQLILEIQQMIMACREAVDNNQQLQDLLLLNVDRLPHADTHADALVNLLAEQSTFDEEVEALEQALVGDFNNALFSAFDERRFFRLLNIPFEHQDLWIGDVAVRLRDILEMNHRLLDHHLQLCGVAQQMGECDNPFEGEERAHFDAIRAIFNGHYLHVTSRLNLLTS